MRVLAISINKNGSVNTLGLYTSMEEARRACDKHWQQETRDVVLVYLTYNIDEAPLGGQTATFTDTPPTFKPPLRW